MSALRNVPIEYLIQQLHDLAPHYWNKPETANCTLVIPLPNRRRPDNVDSAPRISLRLHRDYLAAKSPFLRELLNGVSSHDLIQSRSPSHHQPLRLPRSRLPRILPSSPSHPTIFLPVPDTSSIHLLIHWIYFGNTDYIENALDQGDIHWEGLVRNVEYLGLSTEIKAFLGRWYRNWVLPCSSPCTPCPTDEEDDDEDEGLDADWDSDCDDCNYESPCTPPTDDERSYRGRTRDIKHLLQSCKLSDV